jgi:hypothetical protein
MNENKFILRLKEKLFLISKINFGLAEKIGWFQQKLKTIRSILICKKREERAK